jgi:uncharacterized protein (DUF2336 family)
LTNQTNALFISFCDYGEELRGNIMQVGERYAKLLELARENSSEKRRELLSDVTSLFFMTAENRSDIETNLFGELMTKVASELDIEVRKELSSRFSDEHVPRRLIVALANDPEVSVAEPILTRSRVLSQADLIAVVEKRGDSHRMLVTKRPDVSEALAAALVAFGGDSVVESLVGNETAQVSLETFDKIVDRALANPALQNSLVNRHYISPEHLNQLFMSVNGPMRSRILARNAEFSEAEIDEALERARTRVAISRGALPDDYEAAQRSIASMVLRHQLSPAVLPTLWRDNKLTQFKLAFAELVGIDFHQTVKLFGSRDLDGIAMVARAAGFERALFVTLGVLVLGEQGMGETKGLRDMYNDVPQEAAQRAVRFMKLRAGTLAKAA